MEINDVDRYDEAVKRLDDLQKEYVQRMADAKQESINAKDNAVKFLSTMKGMTVVRAMSGNFYISDGVGIWKADNVIVSAEDEQVVEA